MIDEVTRRRLANDFVASVQKLLNSRYMCAADIEFESVSFVDEVARKLSVMQKRADDGKERERKEALEAVNSELSRIETFTALALNDVLSSLPVSANADYFVIPARDFHRLRRELEALLARIEEEESKDSSQAETG